MSVLLRCVTADQGISLSIFLQVQGVKAAYTSFLVESFEALSLEFANAWPMAAVPAAQQVRPPSSSMALLPLFCHPSTFSFCSSAF